MKYSHYFLICMLQLFQVSCNEEVPTIGNIEIKTTTVRAYSVEATVQGQLIVPKGRSITEYGVAYGHDLNNLIYSASSESLTSEAFVQKIGDLTVSTNYYFAVYAKLKDGRVIYGDTLSRQTDKGIAPTISTTDATNFTLNTFDCGGSITETGQSPVIRQGIVWGTTDTPADTILYTDLSKRQYTITLSGLTTGTTYYYRAFAVNTGGVSLGEIKKLTFGVVNVTTAPITAIRVTSAISGGTVSTDGSFIISRGVCWSNSPDPTVANNKTTNGTGPGSFEASLTGLSFGSTYYVRAYATSVVGTTYGSQMNFTIENGITLNTAPATSITANSATIDADILDDGGLPVSVKGLCYSTSKNPTIADSKVVSESGTSSFSGSITDLSKATTYYVRSYATNANGTFYGNEINFTTKDGVVIITATLSRSGIYGTPTVTVSIPDDGGSPITERGMVVNGQKVRFGSGTGTFSEEFETYKTYTVYGYATNRYGTSYSEWIRF